MADRQPEREPQPTPTRGFTGIMREIWGRVPRILLSSNKLAEIRAQERLEGAQAVARLTAHRVNNDIADSFGALDLVINEPGTPEDIKEMSEGGLEGLGSLKRTVVQLQTIVRVVTTDTPVGPMLNLETSIADPSQDSKP